MAEPITVRLSEDVAVQLRSLATFDRVTLAEEIREAIILLLQARQNDPSYRERVQAAFEEARRQLQALDGTQAIVGALGDPFAGTPSTQPRIAPPPAPPIAAPAHAIARPGPVRIGRASRT